MNIKEYMEQVKEKFNIPRDWAIKELHDHYEAYQNNDIEKININLVEELRNCNTWEYAEDIANRYII